MACFGLLDLLKLPLLLLEVPPAGSADIAGNVEAKILVTAPSGPVIKMGYRGKDFPCHTWAEDIHLEEHLVSEGHNMERSQA